MPFAVPLSELLILTLANGWAARRGCENLPLLQCASLPVLFIDNNRLRTSVCFVKSTTTLCILLHSLHLGK